MNAKWKTAVWLFLWVSGSFLSACSTRAVQEIPDTDIVFQSMFHEEAVSTLGFVDADGSDLIYVEVRSREGMPAFPAWTPDGSYLVFRSLHTIAYAGNLFAIGPDRGLI